MKNTIQKDSIKTRKSIRTYRGEKISAIGKEKIINYLNNHENLAGIKLRQGEVSLCGRA
jgi:hypothetical protein